jgi:DNA-binding GntR family transcriptional regulator
MTPPLAPVDQKPETLTDTVYARLHEAIVSRSLPPGSRITEAGIAQQLSVSKTPVREALLRLREIGLIEPEDVRGNRVVSPSLAALRDAYEYRRVLETFTARAAAERASAEAIEEIQAAAERSLRAAETHDLTKFREPDRTFHRLIAEASGNARMVTAIDNTSTLIRALRQRDLPGAEAVIEFGESHLRVARAIAARDGDAAADAMWTHLQQVEDFFLAQPDDAHAEAG